MHTHHRSLLPDLLYYEHEIVRQDTAIPAGGREGPTPESIDVSNENGASHSCGCAKPRN